MSMHLAAIPLTNATVICVGGISASEAENARVDGYDVDGLGYYLFIANQSDPQSPIQVLAKFFSPEEAEMFGRAIHRQAGSAHI